jgi:hypothetical protein
MAHKLFVYMLHIIKCPLVVAVAMWMIKIDFSSVVSVAMQMIKIDFHVLMMVTWNIKMNIP